ncbi:MAG TPA: hypothetical protein VJU86_07655 [Pyrinomonadaceae bacterium]|nr:hypothetical protein [Pyrinomonadaceae bacterium]
MKKELVKGITMVMAVVAIALTTAAVSANAQSAKKVVTDVPFDFIIGDKTLSAGEYSVKSLSAPENALLIQDADGKSAGVRLAFPITPRNNRGARLVFHQYGKKYFLAEVWTGAGEVGRHLTKSRQERAIERELSTIASKSEMSESMYKVVEVVAVYR